MTFGVIVGIVVAIAVIVLLVRLQRGRVTTAPMPLQIARPLGAPRGSSQEMTVTFELAQGEAVSDFTLETTVPSGASVDLTPQDLFEVSAAFDSGVLQMTGQSRLVSGGSRSPVHGPAPRIPLGRIQYEVQHSPDEDEDDGGGLGGWLEWKPPDRPAVRDDWLREVTFPRRERERSSAALRNFLTGPSWRKFLRLLDVGALEAAERQIRKGYQLAIQQTRDHVEQTETDPARRAEMMADLSEMERIARDRIEIKFDEMLSLGDIGALFEPVDQKPLWELRSDGRTRSLETVDPALEQDSEYRFFRKPKVKFRLGTERDVPQSLEDVYFKRVGFQIDIFEERATLAPPPDQPPAGDEEMPPLEQPEIGASFRRSRLRLELAGKDLLRRDAVAELTVELNYMFQNRPNARTYTFGFEGKTTPGLDDLELQFRLGFDF